MIRMKTVILLIICLMSVACVTKQNKNGSEDQDTLRSTDGSLSDTTKRSVGFAPGEARRLLQGIWDTDEDSNAMFTIKGDSLYYFEDPDPVYVEVRADSFKVLIEGSFFSSRIVKLDNDSLIRIEYQKLVKLYKRK